MSWKNPDVEIRLTGWVAIASIGLILVCVVDGIEGWIKLIDILRHP